MYFEKLPRLLPVVGAEVRLDEAVDATWRSANLRVTYSGRHIADLGVMKLYVLLEIGSARVTPFVLRDMSSFVHDHLDQERMLDQYEDNRPKAVRCVHPLVTLLEKLDALHRRFPKDHIDPASFVRHFRGCRTHRRCRRNLGGDDRLRRPASVGQRDADEQAIGLTAQRDGQRMDPGRITARTAIRTANAAIAPMFWGKRSSLDEACDRIRERIAKL